MRHITWIDSVYVVSQIDISELPKPTVVESIGWLVEETDSHVTITRDKMGKDLRGVLCIPRCSIEYMETLHRGALNPSHPVDEDPDA
jgi:hypothetical protein